MNKSKINTNFATSFPYMIWWIGAVDVVKEWEKHPDILWQVYVRKAESQERPMAKKWVERKQSNDSLSKVMTFDLMLGKVMPSESMLCFVEFSMLGVYMKKAKRKDVPFLSSYEVSLEKPIKHIICINLVTLIMFIQIWKH